MGYFLAGFEMTGVDNRPQPHYPFRFILGDALEYLDAHGHEYDFIAASPPCQGYSVTQSLHTTEHPRLVAQTRECLLATGKPYVIENVVGADLRSPILLCGSSFGLGVRRHRHFETSPALLWRPECVHHLQPEPLDVTGTGGPGGRHRKPKSLVQAREAMGISWMTRREIVEAIPPAYTEFIGEQLLNSLERVA